MAPTRSCFGFFAADDTCKSCAIAQKCKPLLVADGFDLASDLLEEMIATLPDDRTYMAPKGNPGEAEWLEDLLAQIIDPTATVPEAT